MKKFFRFASVAAVAAVGVTAVATQPGGLLKISPEEQATTTEVYVNPALFEDPANPSPTLKASGDSAQVTFNVTYDANISAVKQVVLLPTDITKLGLSQTGKKNAYTFDVPMGNYEIYIWASRSSYRGHAFYWKGDLEIKSDTTFTINTADINIGTILEPTTPDGSKLNPDLLLSKPGVVAEKGNTRPDPEALFAARFMKRNVHFGHSSHTLIYQKLDTNSTAISNSYSDPNVYVNDRNIPIDFMVGYRINGDDGVYGIRFDINKSNFGDTLRVNQANWQMLDLKHADYKCDSVPTAYDPTYRNNNGSALWLNGQQQYCGIGSCKASPTDVRWRYWINAKPNVPNDGYSWAILPGVMYSSIGSRYYGVCPLPLVAGEGSKPTFAPFQPILTGLKIWASSDGTAIWYDNQNHRLNPDAETIWLSGFPYSGMYPTYASKVTGPQYDIDVKGFNGEQRASDLIVSDMAAYRQKDNMWEPLWEGKFEKLSLMNTAMRTSITNNGAGRFAVELVDTNYMIGGVQGYSVTRSEFNTANTADFNAPTFTMINVRDKNDRITDHMKNVEGATVEVMAADLTGIIVNYYGYKRADIKSVKVEYAPNGSTDFIELPVTENVSRKMDNFWGQNYSADLEKINVKSANKLYDLRITATDFSGNTASVYASPAFQLDNIVGLDMNSIGESYIVAENGTIRAAGMPEAEINVYDLQGRLIANGIGTVDVNGLAGLFIVKAADASNTLTSKVLVK